MSSDTTERDLATLPQGDLRLLETEVAKRLLASTTLARFAYVAKDGTPRVIPTWFKWNGEEIVMPTFLSAPHIANPAARLKALREKPDVAITIDTETAPPNSVLVRGRATITEVDGIDPDYADSARRYLGEDVAKGYLSQLDQPGTRMARIAVRPAWVGVLDFQTRSPGAIRSAGSDS
jgi:nitroimidazol reductase NimA-like FMN-containing flavoprotein (pyridoxamine 5'-phosphate oxidase superfamily)